MLEGVDDGRAHNQREPRAHGVDRRHAEHQQAAGDQEPSPNAKETTQHAHDQAEKHQERGVDDDVGVREEHRCCLPAAVPAAANRPPGTPSPRRG